MASILYTSMLSRLESPYWVLDVPKGIHFIGITLFIFAEMGCLALIYNVDWNRHPFGVKLFVYAIGFGILLSLLSKKMWRRWVVFAADKKGVYIINNEMSGFIFILWDKVGESYVGLSERNVKSVILKLRLDENDCAQVFGTYQTGKWMAPDAKGYFSISIGNCCRNVENSRIQIEQIRKLAFSDGCCS
ncbi:hypothetical protein PL263_02055 [Methylomonas sp. EFPC3]|uniref:hypothetical protein n=1 Tax=Methylomonas sp. EFPC3 TaxID=3021710 RepID=UPI00241682BE|nr:hypothetical protein [Methylomonas sp. EFPC3]WFP50820.1 hypothetical protein PL263_02055 [Methylomonas sp. EFPC3]